MGKINLISYNFIDQRFDIEVTCPMTGDITTEEVQVHGNIEKSLTAKYIAEGYELPFSNQLQ